MRVFYGVLCLLMLLFAAVQYNDADAAIWMVIYGVPAVWTGITALFPGLLANRALRSLLVLSLSFSPSRSPFCSGQALRASGASRYGGRTRPPGRPWA